MSHTVPARALAAAFCLEIHGLACDPVDDLCRTVRYAAEQLGLDLTDERCEPARRAFRAEIVGDRPERLLGLLQPLYPTARLALEEVREKTCCALG